HAALPILPPTVADLTASSIRARAVERLVLVQAHGRRHVQTSIPREQEPLMQLDVVAPGETVTLVETAHLGELAAIEQNDAAADRGPRLGTPIERLVPIRRDRRAGVMNATAGHVNGIGRLRVHHSRQTKRDATIRV